MQNAFIFLVHCKHGINAKWNPPCFSFYRLHVNDASASVAFGRAEKDQVHDNDDPDDDGPNDKPVVFADHLNHEVPLSAFVERF
jgi:hypothetical protein